MAVPVLSEVAQIMYDQAVKAKYQSEGFLFKNTTQWVESFTGRTVQFRKMGEIIANPVGFSATVPLQNQDFTAHQATVQKYVAASAVDDVEQIEVNFDVRMQSARQSAMAIGRRSDQILIDVMNASVPNLTIPAGGSNMTAAKLSEALTEFDKRAVPPPDRYVAMTASQKNALLQDDKFLSTRYTIDMPIMYGKIEDYQKYGFNLIIVPEMVEGGMPLNGNVRTCFAWNRDAFGYACNYVQSRIGWLERELSWQVSSTISCGATIVDNLGFIKIECDEAA